jgi:aminocarboxymuconate-semialdehyde decarboxylase
MVVILDGERVLKVDSHTHILPNGWPDEFDIPLRLVKYDEVTAKGFAARLEYKATGKLFRELKPNCFDAEIVLKQCDSCGVDVQVCCTVPVMFNYNLPSDQMVKWAQFLNDDLARVVNTRPDRLAGLGTLPLQDTAASVAEVARCVKMGIKGFQIGSHVNAFRGYQEDGVTPIVENLPLNHVDLRPVFAECARLGACLMVHPWDMEWWCVSEYWQPWLVGMPSETTLAGTALILGGVMSQLPTLRVMMSHGGGSLAWLRGRIDWGYKCRPDLVAKDCPDLPSTLIKRFYFDSITHDEVCLQEIVRYVGPEKVMLGSDYPFPLGEVPSIAPSTEEHLKAYPGQLIQDTGLLTHEQKKKLLALSCMEWLGMDPQLYSHRLLDHTICAQLACPPPSPSPIVVGAGEAEGPNGESKKEEYDYVPTLEYFPVAEEDRSLRYVFCYTIVLPFFLVCGVSVSLLSAYGSLLAFSDTT